ncbi:MAG: YggT family protein [Armatimonadetes bacterium]|nr:YggT family protein [Armatimonadota bacterium]
MPISNLIYLIFEAYYIVLLVRVVMSWVRLPSSNPVTATVGPIVYALTEPLLRPIRNVLRPYQGGVPIDFSPLLLMLALGLVQGLLLRITAGL